MNNTILLHGADCACRHCLDARELDRALDAGELDAELWGADNDEPACCNGLAYFGVCECSPERDTHSHECRDCGASIACSGSDNAYGVCTRWNGGNDGCACASYDADDRYGRYGFRYDPLTRSYTI